MPNNFEGLVDPPRIVKPKIIKATPNSVRKMTRTRWAWYPFIPLGEITILNGPTDVGKSTVCLDLSGALTRGKLDGEFEGTPINVLYTALEDTIETDIAPKLEATDADRTKFWDVTVQNGWINLPEDIEAMAEMVDQTSAKVVFIDPITSVIAGDRNKAEIVRPALESIREFAEKKSIAVVGITHKRKGNSGSATESISGSSEWSAVSRCVLAIGEHREQPGKYILSIPKSNRIPKSARRNLIYEFDHKPVDLEDGDEPQMTPKIKWLGETGLSVDDMMQDAASGVRGGEAADAALWLEAYLADNGGEAEVTDINKAGRTVGLSESALRSARDRLQLGSDISAGGITWTLRDKA